MDDLLSKFIGIDKDAEILTLWFELTFLRILFSEVVSEDAINKIDMDMCREKAKKIVTERFKGFDIVFTRSKESNI